MPRPDFPTSILEFTERFRTDEACYEFLRRCRWPDGFKCPACEHDGCYPRSDRWGVECARCGRVTSVTAGTVMHKSHTSHRTWLWAAWLMVTSKRGTSALELQRQLGIKTYQTAFQILHKLRAAMVSPDQTPLSGTIEVDETYVGGPEPGSRGRGARGKAMVVGAVECRNGSPKRLRFRVIEHADAATLHKFIYDVTEKDAVIQTDAHNGYLHMKRKHQPKQSNRPGQELSEVLPCYHTAVANLKAWLLGTHHGAVRKKHLQAYLNEFAFRYNRRGNLQAAFLTLLGLAPKVEGPTYAGLYSGEYEHAGRG